jgi:3'(2'), 5'-bisphosphate nucleotidase
MDDLTSLTQQVLHFAREAGRRVMRFYRQERTDAVKADSSPLTAADLASHEFLVGALSPLLPGVRVISEESEQRAGASISAPFWLVDPLDGTKEFIKATDEFTVNIALVESGRPILGVVHAPALNQTYYGASGNGSWKMDGEHPPARISCRRWNPARLAVVASRDHAGPLVKTLLERLPQASLQSMGSSLKFCLVAEGNADIYLRDLPTMEWDTAAAQCVVEAAGGGVFDLAGARLQYGKDGLKNPAIVTVGDSQFDWAGLLTSKREQGLPSRVNLNI